MTRRTFLFLAMLLTPPLALVPAFAQDTAADALALWRAEPTTVFQAEDVEVGEFLWSARPLVVFAESEASPDFVQQMNLIADAAEGLARRDVVVVVDTNPREPSALRRKLRPRGFMIALIGKDGEVEFRKPRPRTVRELSRLIDKTTIRQQELRGDG